MVSIVALIAIGIAAISAFFFFRRAGEVGLGPAGSEVGIAFQEIGGGIGSFGTGFKTLGTGIGAGITGLFDPLSFFKNLIFGNTPIVNNVNPQTVQAGNAGGQIVGSSSGLITKQPSIITPTTPFLAGPAPP